MYVYVYVCVCIYIYIERERETERERERENGREGIRFLAYREAKGEKEPVSVSGARLKA